MNFPVSIEASFIPTKATESCYFQFNSLSLNILKNDNIGKELVENSLDQVQSEFFRNGKTNYKLGP